ncbi:hypothetical protein EA462_13165 [Natrarchaeobius halalkaliphilus]|uniref:ParB-like N-terminal domain-containing protein n=1 Tax=Natrarchaeobius halalkaliphilus TaxID=1679091 RepID=A0A3N6MST2_9EURY|nr:ParB/RepB/Spo0J family partition protein [Natrarchaeobius halalkaliphilus]RQG87815.1 hypothetical protein EA462_13165 [Natrarchaeobius halalkaliphilus]
MSGTTRNEIAIDEPPFEAGDIVVDREDDSPSEAIVVNVPPIVATEWTVNGRGPLASDNPTYPADDRVVIVIYRTTLDGEYPYYTGGYPIPLERSNQDDVTTYAFPSQRLRRVGTLSPIEIQISSIDPSPYHARNFTTAQNGDFVAEITERGYPDPAPLVRRCDGRFEIVNGHKRIWACHVAGFETVPCHCAYLDDETATRLWARWHLDTYDRAERSAARHRIRSTLGSRADEILEDVTPKM